MRKSASAPNVWQHSTGQVERERPSKHKQHRNQHSAGTQSEHSMLVLEKFSTLPTVYLGFSKAIFRSHLYLLLQPLNFPVPRILHQALLHYVTEHLPWSSLVLKEVLRTTDSRIWGLGFPRSKAWVVDCVGSPSSADNCPTFWKGFANGPRDPNTL
jgi:hypothetical protein